MVDPEKLPPFTIDLRSMNATFEDQVGGAQFGAPRSFTADVTTTEQPGGPSTQSEISPNHPVTLDGADVFLLGNGYAPVITVRDGSGAVLYQQATPFLPQDNDYTSVGAIKVAGRAAEAAGVQRLLPARPREPTYANGPTSVFPDDRNPELALSVWEGDLFPANRPQSVYTLDTTNLTQLTKADGTPLLIRLQPGQTFQLPDGRGSISFDKVDRFAGLSVRVDPGKELTLVAAIATILGLMASLLVRRRRIFVRVRPTRRPLAYPRHHRWSGADFGPRARSRCWPGCAPSSAKDVRYALGRTSRVLQPRAVLGDGRLHGLDADLRGLPRGARSGRCRARVEAALAGAGRGGKRPRWSAAARMLRRRPMRCRPKRCRRPIRRWESPRLGRARPATSRCT